MVEPINAQNLSKNRITPTFEKNSSHAKKHYGTATFRSFRTLLSTIVVLTSYVIAQIGECMVPEALRRMGWVLPPHQPWQSGADIYAVKGNEILVGQINDFAMKSFIKPDRWMRYLHEFDAHPEATIKAMFISFKNNLTKDQVRDCLERNIIIVIIGFQILSMDEGVLQLVINSIVKGIVRHHVAVRIAKIEYTQRVMEKNLWYDAFCLLNVSLWIYPEYIV